MVSAHFYTESNIGGPYGTWKVSNKAGWLLLFIYLFGGYTGDSFEEMDSSVKTIENMDETKSYFITILAMTIGESSDGDELLEKTHQDLVKL